MQLEEDGVGIIDGHLSNLYNLRNAIYVDTPMSVTSDFTNNRFWNALREMMTEENKSNEPTEVKKLLLRIKSCWTDRRFWRRTMLRSEVPV